MQLYYDNLCNYVAIKSASRSLWVCDVSNRPLRLARRSSNNTCTKGRLNNTLAKIDSTLIQINVYPFVIKTAYGFETEISLYSWTFDDLKIWGLVEFSWWVIKQDINTLRSTSRHTFIFNS